MVTLFPQTTISHIAIPAPLRKVFDYLAPETFAAENLHPGSRVKVSFRNNIPIILGSATPSLESLYNCENHRYQLLELNQRAGQAKMPHFRIIDQRTQKICER
ncbi:MAG: hypothetical protein ACHQ1D_08730 [Nitrososphaerales archaeon]